MTVQWVDFDKFNRIFDMNETGGGAWIKADDTSTSSKGELNAFYGLKHTEESKKQMSESRKISHSKDSYLKKHRARYTKRYEFLNPQGERVIHIGTMSELCREHNLNIKSMFDVWYGKYSQHHGWRKA